jgi:hypothetical protein
MKAKKSNINFLMNLNYFLLLPIYPIDLVDFMCFLGLPHRGNPPRQPTEATTPTEATMV